MKRRISPATVIAGVALFFSLAGAGMAASGYRITSIWQIAPQVRHQLRGERGSQGPGGAAAWANTYAADARADLTAEQPATSLTANCNPGDHVVAGGFSGDSEIVTSSVFTYGGWTVWAHRDPQATGDGFITAWALCAR